MNILLIGNGFDIYHNFPTKYENFLHAVDFLEKNYNETMQNVSDVFSNKKLQDVDGFIKECYKVHKESYKKSGLNRERIIKLIELSKKNLWFKYLLNSFNKDVGWIDFEREIVYVIRIFKDFLADIKEKVKLYRNDIAELYVIKQFNFFMSKYDSKVVNGPNYKVNSEYIYEYPFGSNNCLVDKEKIVETLHKELNNLSEMLKIYLEQFVEEPLLHMANGKSPIIQHIDSTISCNYTHTCNKLYPKNEMIFIHGELGKKIILGVNPDESDKRETIDVSFVKFKKYFQRVQFDTDMKYIEWSKEVTEEKYGDIFLTVFGHSLDKTDEDLIVELFYKSSEITILYHNEEAKQNYIRNLIKIFGREEFQKIRKGKNLKFLNLCENLDEYINHLSFNELSRTYKRRYSF